MTSQEDMFFCYQQKADRREFKELATSCGLTIEFDRSPALFKRLFEEVDKKRYGFYAEVHINEQNATLYINQDTEFSI